VSDRHTGRYVRRLVRVEPPAVELPALEPTAIAPTAATASLPRRRAVRGHAVPRQTPHDGRSGRPARPAPGIVLEPGAARFAESALRLVLEAIDGRRPVAQLKTVLDPRIVTTVAGSRSARAGRGAAVLLRTRVRAVDAETAEIFGSYSRGPRVFAFAGRMVLAAPRARAPRRWTITTLWLG